MIKKSLIGILVLFTFCKNTDTVDNKICKENKRKVNDSLVDKKLKDLTHDLNEELETNEELVSTINFKSWRGTYNQVFEYSDIGYNEFVFNSEINLIKPDSCYFEYWYETKDKRPVVKNNHTKIFGKLYPSSENNSSVQFFETRMIIGVSPEQSPVFSLTNKEGKFYILSVLTTPPHNGVIEMPVYKK